MYNILISTYRNFVRNPVTNFINLIGLAISLALVIILSVYSFSELTTDNFHKNIDRLYLYGDFNNRMYMPAILKDQVDLNIPEVESSVRLAGSWEAPVFQVDDRDPITSDIVFADVDFFNLFSYQTAEGDLEDSLNELMSVVITKSLAEKLFGNDNALGKNVKMNNNKLLTVSAVIDEPKANSCLSFSAITSVNTRKIIQPNEDEYTNWGWNNFQLFILLKKGANPYETAKKMAELFPKNDYEQEDNSKLQLNPFNGLYFSQFALYGNDSAYLHGKDKMKMLILMMVALLVLIIALVNFINISTSQWLEKLKHIGVLKVIGARRSTIFLQLLAEAFLLFLMALLLAQILVNIVYPLVQNYTGIKFNPHILYTPYYFIISITATFLLSVVFSSIPIYRVSSSKAIDNLKKKIEPDRKKSIFRGVLVAAQFSIAIVLIAFTLLVQKQVDFGSSNLGFNQSNVVGINITPQLHSKKEVLMKLLEEKPGVDKISFTQYFPGKTNSHWVTNQTVDGVEKHYQFDTFNADVDFFDILGLQLVNGRLFSDKLTIDQHSILVNETFVCEHKIDNPIGTKLIVGMEGHQSEIIGVVKDFHYKAVSEPILPLLIRNEPNASICLVRLQTSNFALFHKTIQDIKTVAAELSPSFPVEITFLDQAVKNMYQSELQFRKTFSLFAICAIAICCLGILAMSLFACQIRVKEIGIRKVNGARISEILMLLNKDFVKWVAIAFVIATPIAWYAMNKWLQKFAYKTELSWWIFALAGLMALGIAMLTVSWQSWQAARRNPVEALRNE